MNIKRTNKNDICLKIITFAVKSKLCTNIGYNFLNNYKKFKKVLFYVFCIQNLYK